MSSSTINNAGTIWEILGDVWKPASGSYYTGIVASPALGIGVWSITGYVVLNKQSGAFTISSSIEVLWDNVTGCRIYPASSGLRFPLPSTNTTSQIIIPIGTINIVVTTTGVIQTFSTSIIR